jgi:hypothetical protein
MKSKAGEGEYNQPLPDRMVRRLAPDPVLIMLLAGTTVDDPLEGIGVGGRYTVPNASWPDDLHIRNPFERGLVVSSLRGAREGVD